MMKVDPKNLVYNEHFPHNPTDKQLEDSLYDLEIPLDNGDNVANFDEIQKLFEQWDQSEEDEDMRYDTAHSWLWDCIWHGILPIVSTDALEYARDLVRNMTDDDPLAVLTESDAENLIRLARSEYGYSIPEILTPALFLELYEDMKPEED